MRNEFIFNLIAKRFTKEISEEETLQLDKWCNENSQNKKLYKKLIGIWEKSLDTNIDFNPEIQVAIETFKDRVRKAERKKQGKVIRMRIAKLAASAAILIACTLYFISQKQDFNTVEIITDNTSTRQIMLPDSSYIHLNKNTTIKYQKSFENRIVDLSGEAFFEVKKQNGKSFSVKSNNTYTQVLGTSFNIKSGTETSGDVQVYLLTGKIRFSGEKDEKAVILTPNQHAVYKNEISDIEVTELANNNILAWKTGILIFDNITLDEVLITIKEVYDIKYSVASDELLALKVTCNFDNVEIEEVLNDLQIILPIKITKKNKLIEIGSIE